MFKECLLILARRFPTLYFLSKQLRVVYANVEKVVNVHGSSIRVLAETDGRSMYLYKDWAMQDEIGRVVTVIHELLHVLLEHPFRKVEMVREKSASYPIEILDAYANTAIDAKVNFYIKSLGVSSDLTFFGFRQDEVEKLSAEELFEKLLEKEAKAVAVACDLANPGSLGNEVLNGQVLNEGKQELVKAPQEELKGRIEKVIVESLIAAKAAGYRLTNLEEWILNSLLESKVSWRSLLRQAITNGIAKTFMQTWLRVSRKIADFPGYRQISKPHVWCFVDVSGSISYKEFEQFMSEVLKASKESAVTLVTWDVVVRDVRKVRRLKDVTGVKFKHGGGTVFAPIVSQFKQKIKATDVFVCLTDGCWADTKRAVSLIKQLKAVKKILVTTHTEIKGFDTVIKLEHEA